MRKKILLFLAIFLLGYGINASAEEVVGDDMADMPAGTWEEETELQEDNVLYNVSLPAESTVYLDPGNLSGRGQIFSDQYKVENYGNTEIAIKINNIDIYYASSEQLYEFSANKITDSGPAVKRLNVDMVWKNENEESEKILNVSEDISDEYVLYLKAAEYDEDGEFVSLSDGGTGFFSFTGTVNPNSNLVWEDGEIAVRFNYEIVNIEEEKEPETDADTEENQEIPEDSIDSGGDEEKSEGNSLEAVEDETALGSAVEEPEGDTNIEENQKITENSTDIDEKEEKSAEDHIEDAEDELALEESKDDTDTEEDQEIPEDSTDTGEKNEKSEGDTAGAIENPDTEVKESKGVAENEKDTEKTVTKGNPTATLEQ